MHPRCATSHGTAHHMTINITIRSSFENLEQAAKIENQAPHGLIVWRTSISELKFELNFSDSETMVYGSCVITITQN